ncbi:acetoacetate--CoA ligase [Peristeroidobacter soli]|uniref:acetoacetate--CoA ligase n=1 Tax=Peristeroidobacter soli TaxID=2497877 RepID=UPI001300894E|nr:acetoacetate--CoA ligase [Peristeroidobacter soli]
MEPAAQPIWTPSPERARNAALTRFSHYVQERYKAPVHDYASLHRWSVEFPEHFWNAVWDFCEIRSSQNAQLTIEDGARMPGAKWFVGALLNYAENLIPVSDDSIAIIFRNEAGQRRELTRRELRSEVARVADGLKQAGVKMGDRVAGYLPNIPEAVIAMLATTSIGAIWSSCPAEFDVSAVTDRFGQIEPRVLFATDSLPSVAAMCKQISSIERVVLVPYLNTDAKADQVPHGVLFSEFGRPDQPLTFTQLPFEQPAFIVYSSGKTGAPKCIVHSAGGALIQQKKENMLHSDLGAEDRYLHVTTCGSAMWNTLASGLATGATIVLFDGTPSQSDPKILWRMAAEERVTIFGTDPEFLTTCEQLGLRPREEFDLSALRTVLLTGAPPGPTHYRYVYRDVHPDIHLASLSDSTDLMTCLGTGCPTLPVYEGEMQALGLGMKVQVFDAAGKALIGQQGELVCSQPFPSLPEGFWGDAPTDALVTTYFSRYPNVWWHGELATITPRGGLIVHDRPESPGRN